MFSPAPSTNSVDSIRSVHRQSYRTPPSKPVRRVLFSPTPEKNRDITTSSCRFDNLQIKFDDAKTSDTHNLCRIRQWMNRNGGYPCCRNSKSTHEPIHHKKKCSEQSLLLSISRFNITILIRIHNKL